jgi:hypothetical protein
MPQIRIFKFSLKALLTVVGFALMLSKTVLLGTEISLTAWKLL